MRIFFLLSLSMLTQCVSRIIQVERLSPPSVIRGSTPPLESFDPFGFSKDTTKVNYYREAELKHGRIGMVSATLIPIVEQFTHKQAIHGFDELPSSGKVAILTIMFASEFNSMLRGWKNPYTNPFELKEEYQPGDIGLSFDIDLAQEKNGLLLDKELNNGRLAMIASLGMIVQELVTNQPLFYTSA